MKIFWIIPALILLLSACNALDQAAENGAGELTIYRDQYGTPHVVADSNRGVYFGFGYVGRTPGLAFFAMQSELSELLGRKVDLKTPQDLSRYFRDRVLEEARIIYDAA